jgi:hypothetical protein
VKEISIRIIGFAAAFAIAPALAEDLTAGKTPAQLFRSDCGTCHHSPSGLVKERRDVGSLTGFLREHYTTTSGSAAALAAYVSGFGPGGGPARSRGSGNRNDADAPRPPRGVPTSTQVSEPADPVSQLRNFLSSGVGSEGASDQTARTGTPKVHKRRPDDTAAARTNAPGAAPPRQPLPEPEPGKSPEPPGDPK